MGKKGVKAWNALPKPLGSGITRSRLFLGSKDAQSELKTLSGGEFGWGGTSVKR